MSNTEPTPLGPSIDLGFITAALAVFTFTLHVILRRERNWWAMLQISVCASRSPSLR